MPNRAERRAQAKRNRRGVPQQYDQTQGRARSGMLDEYQLQEKSRRLQDGTGTPTNPDKFVHDMADAINRIMADPEKAKRMGQAGYERARDHFSWESIADKTVKVYEDVLAERK